MRAHRSRFTQWGYYSISWDSGNTQQLLPYFSVTTERSPENISDAAVSTLYKRVIANIFLVMRNQPEELEIQPLVLLVGLEILRHTDWSRPYIWLRPSYRTPHLSFIALCIVHQSLRCEQASSSAWNYLTLSYVHYAVFEDWIPKFPNFPVTALFRVDQDRKGPIQPIETTTRSILPFRKQATHVLEFLAYLRISRATHIFAGSAEICNHKLTFYEKRYWFSLSSAELDTKFSSRLNLKESCVVATAITMLLRSFTTVTV